METRKLTSTTGFVLLDAPEASTSVGPTRLGAKLVAGNAENYARHLTYMFGVLEEQKAGATIGLKVDPADTDAAVAALADELADDFEHQRLLTSAGLRLTDQQLEPVLGHDRRNPIRNDDRGGITFEQELMAAGAIAAAEAVLGGLDGKSVAIEGFGAVGLGIARLASQRGAQITRFATAKGTLSGSFDPATLAGALDEHGPAMVEQLGTPGKPWEIWRGDGIDIAFVGSKPGAMSGEGAGSLGSTAVVPFGTSPISSKALAVLRKAGAPVVADFVSSLGPALAWWADESSTHDDLLGAVATTVAAIHEEVGGHEQGAYLGACHKAEAFMSSWMEQRPFGRPLG